MRSPKLLLALLVVVTVGGLVLLAFQWWILGGIITALGLVLLFLWWKLQQLLAIGDALGKDDIATARAKLAKIKNPDKLNAYSKTYYYFFKGAVEIRDNNFKESEGAFKQALETNRFRAPDDKATAHLMLAQLLLRKRNRQGAKRHLDEARSLAANPQIRQQIKEVAKQGRIRL